MERDDSGNQTKFYKPQEQLYKKTTFGYKCFIGSKETIKENAIISDVRTHYPIN